MTRCVGKFYHVAFVFLALHTFKFWKFWWGWGMCLNLDGFVKWWLSLIPHFPFSPLVPLPIAPHPSLSPLTSGFLSSWTTKALLSYPSWTTNPLATWGLIYSHPHLHIKGKPKISQLLWDLLWLQNLIGTKRCKKIK